MLLYLSQKILYTWQVVGVGAGYIIKVFNYRLWGKTSSNFSGRAHPLKKSSNKLLQDITQKKTERISALRYV